MHLVKIKTSYVPPMAGSSGLYQAEIVDGLGLGEQVKATVESPTMTGIERKIQALAYCLGIRDVIRVESINPITSPKPAVEAST